MLLSDSSDELHLKKFTFEDFITKKYQPKSFQPEWIKGKILLLPDTITQLCYTLATGNHVFQNYM